MNRRWSAIAGAGLLVLVTGVLVLLALRPSAPPAVEAAPLSVGAVEVVGDTTWRWVGPNDCTTDTDIIQLQRRSSDGDWTGARIPLVTVLGITFSDSGENGVAYGTSSSCTRQIAVTDDGGRSWRVDERNPALVDAWWVDQRVWGINNSSGATVIEEFRLLQRRSPRLTPATDAAVASPCQAADGVPSRVAFFTEVTGLVLCEHRILTSRLIARTTDAGANFERLIDSRLGSGLDGEGTIEDLEVAGEENVWLLFSAGEGECPEGQLRFSDSQGQVFDVLPCLDGSLDVDEILSVSFDDPKRGVMLALGDNEPLMLETVDAGETWTLTP